MLPHVLQSQYIICFIFDAYWMIHISVIALQTSFEDCVSCMMCQIYNHCLASNGAASSDNLHLLHAMHIDSQMCSD